MAVFMVSLAGLPPTGGFLAKFCLFKAGIEAGYLYVVIVAIVTTVVSLFYYLRVVMIMFTGAEKQELPDHNGFPALRAAIAVMTVVVFLTGILPGEIIQSIQNVFLH